MRRLCLKTSEAEGRGGLGITLWNLILSNYAYALTLPLLGFECTWYEIKSRDMNEKGKEFIFYNKPYMPSAGLHGPLHMVCALSPIPAPTLVLDLHAHTQLYCLLLLGQRGGGVHVLKCILLIPFE